MSKEAGSSKSKQSPETATRPRTQAERSSRTRQVVCEAVLDCLVEHGWEGVSSNSVAARAGISRGALVHQYPTRNDMYVAAYKFLIDIWREGYPFNTAPGYVRLSITEMIDAIWALIYENKWFMASMELVMVSEKDGELSRRLLEVYTAWVAERDDAAMKILGIDPSDRNMVDLFNLSLATLRGIAMFSNASGEPDYAQRHVERWKAMARAAVDS